MTAPHPEDFCERCGRENACWFAPSEIWNLACRDHGIICPVCFIKLTEAAGLIPTGWQVAPENYGKTDWIPVTERLPGNQVMCWLTVQNLAWRGVLVGRRDHGRWFYSGDQPLAYPVIAWQPIIEPEAYKP